MIGGVSAAALLYVIDQLRRGARLWPMVALPLLGIPLDTMLFGAAPGTQLIALSALCMLVYVA